MHAVFESCPRKLNIFVPFYDKLLHVHVHVIYHVLMLDLCVMRAKSLFVDKNSGLRIITSILHSSATRDPVAQW